MHVFEWDRKVAWSIVKAFDENVVLRMLTFISWDRAVCALLHAYKASVSFQSRPTARHALLMLYLETEVSSPVRWASRVAFSSVAQLCPTLCDPIDGSPPGSFVLGILQARTLEWVAIPFSNA